MNRSRGLDSLRQDVRAFLSSTEFEPRVDAWMTGHDPDFTRALAERGWVGMTIPLDYGGHSRTFAERYVVIEELLASGAPIAAHWFADRQVAPGIMKYGTEVQKRRFLPPIARGELYFGIGLSEHGAGSDLASLKTAARRVDGGWRINGSKVWTSWAHKAGALLALVRTSEGEAKHDGLTQMIIPLPADGLEIQAVKTMSGEHHFNELFFDDVFVPDDLVLGIVGEGWSQVKGELKFERSGPERFLSTFPLLTAYERTLGNEQRATHMAGLFARLWSLRQVSAAVADEITETGTVPEGLTSVVKDLGSTFERESIEAVSRGGGVEPDPGSSDRLARLFAEAISTSAGFTLRGGATEIIRGIISREVLR